MPAKVNTIADDIRADLRAIVETKERLEARLDSLSPKFQEAIRDELVKFRVTWRRLKLLAQV